MTVKLKKKKTETKRKPLSVEKPINSSVIREISPTSGLWREGFMEKKCFEARMKE